MRALVIVCLVSVAGCDARPARSAATAAVPPTPIDADFGFSTPEAQRMDSRPLLDLAMWVRDHPVPLFSFLVSRNGKLVFELYTSSIERAAAHYMMSVTKSVVSALVGIAIQKGLIASPETTIADALPPALFPTPEDRDRFRRITVKDLLGMSALDTPDPPRVHTPEAVVRHDAFLAAGNRVSFALAQPILAEPGTSFLYNDIGPVLATGMVSHAAHETALRFAEENLFGPLGFANYEWMHADASGNDNGGYGLRLRPIDMQKLGVLYLNHGSWGGRQVLPAAWVDTSFTPWIRSSPDMKEPNYGWFWWAESFGRGWSAHEAKGWKGQRIIVVPSQGVVVTMTAYEEDGNEGPITARLIEDYVVPSVEHGRGRTLMPEPALASELERVLEEVRRGPMRGPAKPEPRMIPSIERKSR